MALVLSEDQQILKQTASDFVKKESPVSRIRELRDSGDQLGYSRELWTKMAELGWQGILIPEAYGGLGMGYADMACVLEECGRNLVPEPLVAGVLLGANALVVGGSEAQKSEVLPGVAAGETIVALAWSERGSRHNAFRIGAEAKASGGGYVLSGEKTLVPGGAGADKLVVAARTSGNSGDRDGITLFLIDAGAPGVSVAAQTTIASRNFASVSLKDVEVPAAAVVGEVDGGGAILEEVIDCATLGLCCEMLGASSQAFEMTLDYLKTRKQFGVLIGTFQALKHRAAEMFVELELARSAVLGACEALDAGADDAKSAISVAKARLSDTAMHVGHEAIQMHGGIGMTDEHDIGFYAKRAKADEVTFGDAAYHRGRYAELQGF